jgi:hypothetical protein
MYDASSDLGRVDMTAARVSDITERLTITILPATRGGGLLRISWDQLVATVPFIVVP